MSLSSTIHAHINKELNFWKTVIVLFSTDYNFYGFWFTDVFVGNFLSIRNLFVIMSSSDSDFEVEENSCFGYQYEPEYTEEELTAAAATNEESTMKKMKQLIKTVVPVDIVHFSQNKESASVVNNFNIMMNII